MPIKFKNQCLVCHSAQVKTGEIYPGALAGTMVLQMPMSFQYFSGTAILSVFIVFLLVFITLATIATNHLVQAKLLNPIEALNQRVRYLRFNSTEKRADWQRTPQKVIEVDQIDASISEHIDSLQHLYDKLDMMVVSGHDSSLFHKDRFNEVLKYQMVMTRRYQHPFTLFIIKLTHIKLVNASAKALEQEMPGTRFNYFGEVLQNET